MSIKTILPKESIKWDKARKFGKLTFVPIIEDFIDIEEDLQLKVATEEIDKIFISELEHEDVNQIYIQSSYDHPILVISGTILEGGRQTRTAVRPFILNKNKDKIKIPVNCVEQGRWEYNEKYRVHDDEKRFKFSGKRASRKMKASFFGGSSQSATWSSISQMQGENVISNDEAYTSNYLEIEEIALKKSNEKVEKIKEKISDAFSLENQRGILIYDEGELSSAEIFQSSIHWKSVSTSIMDSNIPDLLKEDEKTESTKKLDLNIENLKEDEAKPIADEESHFLKLEKLEGWSVSLCKTPIYVTLNRPDRPSELRMNDMQFQRNIEQIQYQERIPLESETEE